MTCLQFLRNGGEDGMDLGRRPRSLGNVIKNRFTLPFVLAVAACTLAVPADAQQVYRYKDRNGQWVYTDRPPDGQASAQRVSVGGGAASPRIVVQPRSSADGVALVAVNECSCTVEFGVKAKGAVFHHHGLPQGGRQFFGNIARQNIRCTARRKGRRRRTG